MIVTSIFSEVYMLTVKISKGQQWHFSYFKGEQLLFYKICFNPHNYH